MSYSTAFALALAAAAPATAHPHTPASAAELVAFWRAAGPERWFAKDPAFDAHLRARFLALHERAARGELAWWTSSPEGALALVLLIDQFPRNAFRGTPRMYATDPQARIVARRALAAGHDRAVEDAMALFFYLPFGHSESLDDQDRSVALAARLAEPSPANSRRHRDIIRRFGRFPHRNPILGRPMRPEERRYLDEGGYAG